MEGISFVGLHLGLLDQVYTVFTTKNFVCRQYFQLTGLLALNLALFQEFNVLTHLHLTLGTDTPGYEMGPMLAEAPESFEEEMLLIRVPEGVLNVCIQHANVLVVDGTLDTFERAGSNVELVNGVNGLGPRPLES
ncbi:hypothetical protein PoMZ_03813 [Pyricularia oryzae]|uniref:Uncharacterized protein n=1 Tax=Pyricularia oryzae TaxID=318829 RepID=A0A4V1C670_PYROR|nr:hypothetical protein PoMZ_03813 [Pyricularia oryzae]